MNTNREKKPRKFIEKRKIPKLTNSKIACSMQRGCRYNIKWANLKRIWNSIRSERYSSIQRIYKNRENMRYFNYVQLFKSMLTHFVSESLAQLYQFNVTLIAKCARFKKHIMYRYDAMRWRWQQWRLLLMLSFRFVHLCVNRRNAVHDDFWKWQTKSTVMWKIKSRIPYNETFSVIRLRIFSAFSILNLLKGQQQQQKS